MCFIWDINDNHTSEPKPDYKDNDAYMVEYIVTQHNYQR